MQWINNPFLASTCNLDMSIHMLEQAILCTWLVCVWTKVKSFGINKLKKDVDGTHVDRGWNMGGPEVEFTYMWTIFGTGGWNIQNGPPSSKFN
jgi:hypothetical protein